MDDKDERKERRPVDEFPWQEYDKEVFEKEYPALARELGGEGIRIESYREDEAEVGELEDFSGYSPTVIDFLRRCETDDEALEIINWLEERGEITHKMAKELRIQLVKKGVRSFGSKKEWGWYEKHGKH
ncbi:hypothetical protein PAP_08115 [Palaeococcus pacificus DY20341]|uniref:DUF2095 domain-containing protein n=1 Tax=Palaeococcus pacificus DY20341 TaxID=1343739 RepID=A0A075LV42_9EURY|nr:DUF2095 family protein [Palaeococcus pacificus]AIF70011.1 hypothetical protein PAP_08115 [Palaeococcus pacificus DY20341]